MIRTSHWGLAGQKQHTKPRAVQLKGVTASPCLFMVLTITLFLNIYINIYYRNFFIIEKL